MPRNSREVTKRERYDSVRRVRLESRHGRIMSFGLYTDCPYFISFLHGLSDPDEPKARVSHNSFEFRTALHDLKVLHRRWPSER